MLVQIYQREGRAQPLVAFPDSAITHLGKSEDSIGMLIDCHRRIELFLHDLCVVADRARNRTLTNEEVTAVQSALQYFRVGGLRHAADEEESRFPRLRVFSATDTHAELGRLRRRQGAGRRECFLHAQNSGPTQRELYAYPAVQDHKQTLHTMPDPLRTIRDETAIELLASSV